VGVIDAAVAEIDPGEVSTPTYFKYAGPRTHLQQPKDIGKTYVLDLAFKLHRLSSLPVALPH